MTTPSKHLPVYESVSDTRERAPEWLAQTEEELEGFLSLPENWNSYGARPIEPHTVRSAMALLRQIVRPDTPRPIAVPTARGGVQLEWHTRGIDLELQVNSPEQVGVYYAEPQQHEEWEVELSPSDLKPLAVPIERISRPA